MVGHSIVKPVKLIYTTTVGALAVFGALRSVVKRAGQLPEALSMFLLQRGSLLQKGRIILLSIVSTHAQLDPDTIKRNDGKKTQRTLADATLCFSRVRRVTIPIYASGIVVSTFKRVMRQKIETSRKPLTSEYMILSKRALTSSDKAGGAGGAAGGASKGEPALDEGASSLGDDAAGTGPSGIAISAMRRR